MKEMLVDSRDVKRLVEGSYEDRACRVRSILAQSFKMLGEDWSGLSIVGTFPSHAIVADKAGKFHRVSYQLEESPDGRCFVKMNPTMEFVDGVRVYDEAVLDRVIDEEVGSVVDNMMNGRGCSGIDVVLHGLGRVDMAKRLGEAIARTKREARWWKFFDENAVAIYGKVGGSKGSSDRLLSEKSFDNLYKEMKMLRVCLIDGEEDGIWESAELKGVYPEMLEGIDAAIGMLKTLRLSKCEKHGDTINGLIEYMGRIGMMNDYALALTETRGK